MAEDMTSTETEGSETFEAEAAHPMERARARLEHALIALASEAEAQTALASTREVELIRARGDIEQLHQELAHAANMLAEAQSQLEQSQKSKSEDVDPSGPQSGVPSAEVQELTVTLEAEREARATILHEAEVLRERITQLEAQNLSLHEQVAKHSLGDPSGDAEARAQLASAVAERNSMSEKHNRLEGELQALQAAYAQLQAAAPSPDDTPDRHEEADKLKAQLADKSARLDELETLLERYESERDALRAGLDQSISEIESVLGPHMQEAS